MYLIGIQNLIVEVDAQYIKGMLSNPDITPSASINHWIVSILLFHFTLVHVPGTQHGPDGLSQHPPQLGDDNEDSEYNPEFDDWVDKVYGFMHFLNPTCLQIASSDKNATFVSDVIDDLNITNDSVSINPFTYDHVLHSEKSHKADDRLHRVHEWFVSLRRPEDISDKVYAAFLRYCTHFFIKDDRLWKKDPQGHHKLVIEPNKHPTILISAHNEARHHGDFATCAQIVDCFWWPDLTADVAWFVKTCHLCQLRQTRNILIPLVVATPAPLFAKMYMDTMHLPKSGGFKYLVQGRCSLMHYPEYRVLCTKTAKTIGNWIFDNILCRWGTLCEIVTDNGPAFVEALDYLGKQYHIRHIQISGYNSHANGIVERTHFNVCQALFKACNGDQSKWHLVVTLVMWADRITVCRRMGCSPYFAVTGTHPLLPLDIAEATYLLPPPKAPLSTTDLIATHAVVLQKQHMLICQGRD